MSRKPTNIIVKVIDLSGLFAHALSVVQKEKPDCVKVANSRKWGIIETASGVFFLDSDGTGDSDPITETNKAQIELYGEYDTPAGWAADVLPVKIAAYPLSELLRLPVKEQVNLADFIRTFGSRLEQNYSVWKREMELANHRTRNKHATSIG